MRRPSSGNKHDQVGGAEQRERKEGCEFEHCQKVRLIRLMAKDLSKDIKNVLIEANTRVKVSLSAICKTTQKYVEKGKRADFQGWL